MIKQTPGKIYLANQRGLTETTSFRRYSTFNFDHFYNPDKEALDSLQVFNEELLAGNESLIFTLEQDTHVILIPVTGALTINGAQGLALTVEAGEIALNTVPANSSVQLSNPYLAETISFLQIRIKAERPVNTLSSLLLNFNLDTHHNELIPIVGADFGHSALQQLPFSVSIGRFNGRQEAVYKLKSSCSLFFAFVIAGAYEVEGRLLHEKDGLALWDTDEVELEALSNNALILCLEIGRVD